MATFVIDDYYEVLALSRLLLSYKYAPNPMHREIFASPFIASVHARLLETLTVMESERGRDQGTAAWNKFTLDNPVGQLLVKNTLMLHGETWNKLDESEKQQIADAVLTPFAHDQKMIELFVAHVDRAVEVSGFE